MQRCRSALFFFQSARLSLDRQQFQSLTGFVLGNLEISYLAPLGPRLLTGVNEYLLISVYWNQ